MKHTRQLVSRLRSEHDLNKYKAWLVPTQPWHSCFCESYQNKKYKNRHTGREKETSLEIKRKTEFFCSISSLINFLTFKFFYMLYFINFCRYVVTFWGTCLFGPVRTSFTVLASQPCLLHQCFVTGANSSSGSPVSKFISVCSKRKWDKITYKHHAKHAITEVSLCSRLRSQTISTYTS